MPEVIPELNLIPDRALLKVYENMIRIIEWANEHTHDDGVV